MSRMNKTQKNSDQVVNQRLLPWAKSSLPFRIPEFAGLSPETDENFSGDVMSRHWLFVGETGSGKTASGVMPLSRAILRYRGAGDDEMPCSVLIVDPKHELYELAEQELAGTSRLIHLGSSGGCVIDFFEDCREGSLPLKQIFDQVFDAFVPQNKHLNNSGSNMYWHARGKEALYAVCMLAAHLERRGTTLLKELVHPASWSINISPKLQKQIENAATTLLASNYFEERLLSFGSCDISRQLRVQIEKLQSEFESSLWPKEGWQAELISAFGTAESVQEFFAELMNNKEACELLASSLWPNAGNDLSLNGHHQKFRDTIGPLDQFAGNFFSEISAFFSGVVACNAEKSSYAIKAKRTLADVVTGILKRNALHSLVRQFSWMSSTDDDTVFWICDIADSMLGPLKSDELNSRIWLNPVKPPVCSVSIRESVESGKVLLYQPSLIPTHEDDMLGRVFKRLFFRATFSRKERRRGVAYICDEFQRFVTGDEESGEQSFLDRCRAYRTICVFATQSVASIRYALLTQNPSVSQSALEAALAVMLANIGSKFFFRNTDEQTHGMVERMIPYSPAFQHHVMSIRPLSTLRPGECYSLFANGEWGRQQIRLQQSSASDGPAGIAVEPKYAKKKIRSGRKVESKTGRSLQIRNTSTDSRQSHA